MTDTSDMNEGVQLILKRMESNPEEFMGEAGSNGDYGRWDRLVRAVLENSAAIFTPAEENAMRTAALKLRRDKFTAKVLEIITRDPAKYAEESEAQSQMGGRAVRGISVSPYSASTIISGAVDSDIYAFLNDRTREKLEQAMKQAAVEREVESEQYKSIERFMAGPGVLKVDC